LNNHQFQELVLEQLADLANSQKELVEKQDIFTAELRKMNEGQDTLAVEQGKMNERQDVFASDQKKMTERQDTFAAEQRKMTENIAALTKSHNNLAENVHELRRDLRKLDIKVEGQVVEKIRALFDDREVIHEKLDKLQMDVNNLNTKTSYTDTRVIELARRIK